MGIDRLGADSMTSYLPYGGQAIADLRANRQKPADMVLVSLVGPLREINPVVVAQPARRYDWRFLAGLEVLLVASSAVEPAQIKRVSDELLKVSPEYLGVWFVDRQNGLNLAWGSYHPVSSAGRAMGLFERRVLKGIGVKS